MNEIPQERAHSESFDNLLDFIEGAHEDTHLHIEVAVLQDYSVTLFHSQRFKKSVSWFEFDLANNRLDFVTDNGDLRELGLPLKPEISKYMQNTHQILTILMDTETGEAQEGKYIPLIIHKAIV